jgi:hypothetical protein
MQEPNSSPKPRTAEEWRAQYYPEEAGALVHRLLAQGVSKEEMQLECAEHSLRKWKGLRKEVLEPNFSNLILSVWPVDRDSKIILDGAGSTTCSLCIMTNPDRPGITKCDVCPITAARGSPCIRLMLGDADFAPWTAWTHNEDPEPMIKCLEATVEWCKQQLSKADGQPAS